MKETEQKITNITSSKGVLPKIGPTKALEKVGEYLSETDRLKNLGHNDGEPLREKLNYKIKALINNAFDNSEQKIREYDNYVNAYSVVVGEKKTPQQIEKEYQQNLREMEIMLGFYREELEMAGQNDIAPNDPYNAKEIFIVHGHDNLTKNELARFIENELKLKVNILHEQPDKGRTIIEKLEHISKHSGYAFVLLTPDDLGAKRIPDEDIEYFNVTDLKNPKQKTKFNYRARQNVVLELGLFMGLLGRERVCCLYKGGVELPSDFSGILYKEFNKSISEIAWGIRKELEAAGYEV